MSEQLIIMVLLSFLVIITLGIIWLCDLLASVILLGIFSLVAALIFVVMDAVDVAFTEAAVGAGISTILLLGALRLTKREQKPQEHNNHIALVLVFVTGALLSYGLVDMPFYGDPESPAYQHPELAQYFIHQSANDTDIPNIVTSVLASYRGYDTLGEAVVVFTAAIAVLSMLGLRRRSKIRKPQSDTQKDAKP